MSGKSTPQTNPKKKRPLSSPADQSDLKKTKPVIEADGSSLPIAEEPESSPADQSDLKKTKPVFADTQGHTSRSNVKFGINFCLLAKPVAYMPKSVPLKYFHEKSLLNRGLHFLGLLHI